MRKPHVQSGKWTLPEISKMLTGEISQRDAHLIIALALFVGIRRRSEIVRLKWSDLSLDDEKPRVYIRSISNAKRGKAYYVSIGLEILPLLRKYRPAEDEYVVRLKRFSPRPVGR